MPGFFRQRYHARFAASGADIAAAQALRSLCFRGDASATDADGYDLRCAHVLVEDSRNNDRLVCTFRIQHFASGQDVAKSYSAQYYELSALAAYPGSLVEMGRFCVAPDMRDPDILRSAWRMMADYVEQNGIEMLFGCSSFKGAEAESHKDAFALLAARHIAPRRWLPRVKAPSVFRFARRLKRIKPDMGAALRAMPPLLRTYLVMGGWVSDHAVVDRDLNTMHVFTGLEIGQIPAARRARLRA
ncbi:GNAT family N-acetyltransferase [Abyssibius alkaniclasticus]|uniref:GNAT family N-acetyltransferase n=1 Tax=Abyssibius alkaniclasticus TaxID=2881234 RepID=UPI0023642338|nr:GNAT family N-acyltransferase [Abyssibius alkaniclasticus]UPH70053.1 GNAT family N-acetyltransferase [Abyssibius alkaniclasticus]